MKKDLIKPEKIRAIQESICGFLSDKVINPNGEFYTDNRVSVGQQDPDRDNKKD